MGLTFGTLGVPSGALLALLNDGSKFVGTAGRVTQAMPIAVHPARTPLSHPPLSRAVL